MAYLCAECEEELSDDEFDSPYLNGDNLPICFNCYESDYSFQCCMCGNLADLIEEGEIGGLLICVDTEGTGLPFTGVYKVISWPYYYNGMIESSMEEHSLELITRCLYDLENDTDGYPIAHLCRACSEKVKEEHAEKARV